jgi:hypothetical protein
VSLQGGLDVPPRVVQRVRDLTKGQAQASQQTDVAEALDVGIVVNPVSSLRPVRRHQEPDLLIVVQGAHGEPCSRCQLADLVPGTHRDLISDRHTTTIRPHAT